MRRARNLLIYYLVCLWEALWKVALLRRLSLPIGMCVYSASFQLVFNTIKFSTHNLPEDNKIHFTGIFIRISSVFN